MMTAPPSNCPACGQPARVGINAVPNEGGRAWAYECPDGHPWHVELHKQEAGD